MSKFFIRRPIVAIVIAIFMILVGAISAGRLPVSQYPSIVPPEVRVTANYPGANAESVAQSVSTPLAEQISGVDNMNYMYSINSATGRSQILVDFNVKTDPNLDQELTQMRTSQAQTQLPAEVNATGVTVRKSLSSPLMLIALYSPHGSYNGTFLANYGYINMVDQLQRIPGIAEVVIFGAGQYAMRIWVDPQRLAAMQVTVPQIVAAVKTQNTINPGGQIGGEPALNGTQFTYAVQAQGRLVTKQEFGNIILRTNPDGSTLRLKDVADIRLGAENYNSSGRYNGKPSAILAIFQLPGSNAVADAQAIKAKMKALAARFPPDLAYKISLDTTTAVSDSISETLQTLAEALGLVILVVFIFLQDWRATLIPFAAIPVALVGVFIFFPLVGFTINTLTLFGLVLAIGLVVDDAIVVVEACQRHIEEGMTPRDAALKAMSEVAGPVVATALILAAVFLPTVFIPGITGRLYQQFAITIVISVCLSVFNALSLSPALASLLLRPKKEHGLMARVFSGFNRGFDRFREGYLSMSGRLIRKAAFSLLCLVAIAAAAVFIAGRLPTSFVPEGDQGYMFIAMQLPDGASMQRTAAAARRVEKIAMNTPGIQGITSVIGFSLLSRVESSYGAFFFVTEKPWGQRTKPDEQFKVIRAHITRELQSVKDGVAFSFSPPAIPGVGTSGGITFMLEDHSGSGPAFLGANLKKFLAAARKRKELAGVTTTYDPDSPQLLAHVDRAKVIRQGVAISDVYQTLQTYLGGFLVNYFNRFGRQWQVYVEADAKYRQSARDISQFYVSNNQGGMVPLSAFVHLKRITAPEFIMRYNEYDCAQINAQTAPGYSTGQAMKALEEVFHQTMPQQMGFGYMGMSYQESKAAHGLSPTTIFGLAVIFVFLILAAQYESWSLPFSVLLGTPIALFGGYLFLMFRDFDNDIYAQIGVVMLIGLAAKNAILIVDYAKRAHEEQGKSTYEAALIGGRVRLRPILMTAFAFIGGCIPLWLATGAGSLARQIIGTTVIGGMLAASLIEIFIIPVSFVVVERIFARGRGKHRQPKLQPAAREQA
ncbi:MAG: efflux RND transporter permease subunit [Bryobacteraceae bacterium]